MPITFESILGTNTMINVYLICLGVSLLCGALAAFAAAFRSYATKSFLICLILLPMIVTTVIMMVNGNVGTGVAVMGAFSLVRFRSVPGKAKDISAIFLTMTAGLACAAGYVVIAVLFTLLVSLVMVVLSFVPMGEQKMLDLTVTVPETLHFHNAFADVFEKHTSSCRLVCTKTTNMGSLYKLSYKVRLKDRGQIHAFIDDLRVRNGNLEISLAEAQDNAEDL